MSVSDDNLVCSSPTLNAEFNLALDEELGKALSGIAIHSCGNWAHTMPSIRECVPSCVAIDCALNLAMDPCPNVPEHVRDALAGTGIAVQIRMGGEPETILDVVKRAFHPDLRLIVQPATPDEARVILNLPKKG